MAKTWFVIQTRPAAEAKAASSLDQIGVETFFPQETVWRKTLRGRHEHHRPLICGYVFAMMDDGDLWRLHGLDGVAGSIRVARQDAMLEFIGWLTGEVASGAFDRTLAEKQRVGGLHKLAKGSPLKVIAGAYQGFQATFLRMEGRGRARIMFTLFGRVTEATVPEGQLEKAA